MRLLWHTYTTLIFANSFSTVKSRFLSEFCNCIISCFVLVCPILLASLSCWCFGKITQGDLPQEPPANAISECLSHRVNACFSVLQRLKAADFASIILGRFFSSVTSLEAMTFGQSIYAVEVCPLLLCALSACCSSCGQAFSSLCGCPGRYELDSVQ